MRSRVSIPGSTVGIFPEGEDFRDDHGLGRLAELGLRALLAIHPPISPLTSSAQRNCTSWAFQPQKSVTILPCPGGRTTKSTRTCGGGIGPPKKLNNSGKIEINCLCIKGKKINERGFESSYPVKKTRLLQYE